MISKLGMIITSDKFNEDHNQLSSSSSFDRHESFCFVVCSKFGNMCCKVRRISGWYSMRIHAAVVMFIFESSTCSHSCATALHCVDK